MKLTEVRINLCPENRSRLKAFCSLTFDNTFVIRDVKLIEGNGGLFLAIVPGEKGFTKDPTHRTFLDPDLAAEAAAGSGLRLERSLRFPFNAHWVSRIFYLNMTLLKFRRTV